MWSRCGVKYVTNYFISFDSHINQTEQIFNNGLVEGMYICKEGQGGTMQHYTHCYMHNTYDTLLEISGFTKITFLEGDDYRHEPGDVTTREERELFSEYMTWKGSCTGVFKATKL